MEKGVIAVGGARGVLRVDHVDSPAILAEDGDRSRTDEDVELGEVHVLGVVDVPGRTDHEERSVPVSLELLAMSTRTGPTLTA